MLNDYLAESGWAPCVALVGVLALITIVYLWWAARRSLLRLLFLVGFALGGVGVSLKAVVFLAQGLAASDEYYLATISAYSELSGPCPAAESAAARLAGSYDKYARVPWLKVRELQYAIHRCELDAATRSLRSGPARSDASPTAVP
ncbi:hypothetical protein E4T66_17250 [Sinimarinibacterium sp. CAU 1509]|uniref:hypothetical protein n=1 Tax=Sinimarinibacterium sp. CAU 1509 TaxID=2562283 RepID=UPI0010AC5A47|nr:hypothetical protein [Sinimarinibacterium sp. CAU 1509]TJY57158.1 hypothetical protein E4T66_17250 [Sinimarinibacterium sp. CAU 1509]